MTNNVALFIAVEPARGRPVALARVTDAGLLRAVAAEAVRAAYRRAGEAARRDTMLGEICADEARRLDGYLGRMIDGTA